MKQFAIICFVLCYSICFAQSTGAQNEKHDQLLKTVTDYFALERENIHVHFDKNVFTKNESIWFKGYVFHRKKNLPFFTTVNIYAVLLDPDGKIIETQLLYGNIGSFRGHFKLSSNFKSGKYYLQFYTNWMNNFAEDESAVYEVTVIGNDSPAGNITARPVKPVIKINPEGGVLLQGAVNNIGISVSGCGQVPLGITEAEIIDDKGKLWKKVPLNKLGHGKSDIPAHITTGYKVAVTYNNARHEQAFPPVVAQGAVLDVNNYGIAGNTMVKIRTNAASLPKYKNPPLYLLVHQDDKAIVLDISFSNGKTEQTVAIPNTELYDGVNTVRLLDQDFNQLAQRIIYQYPASVLKPEITKSQLTNRGIKISGTSNYPNMNLSVSVLPENTLSLDESRDIYGDLLIAPYISGKAAGRYYFGALSKVKHYELDLFLLNSESKYEWKNIRNSAPKDNFTFDRGLSIKGYAPPSADNKYFKVRLFSLNSFVEALSDINDKNEFMFDNIIITDSSYANFTLLKKGAKPRDLMVVPQVLNGNRKFYKMYKPEPACEVIAADTPAAQLPNVQDGVIELEGVEIEGKVMKYGKVAGNQRLRAVKVGDAEISYNTIANYLRTHGFIVEDAGASFKITTKGISSINAAQSVPAIYVDGIQLYDYDQLRLMRMTEIDEIYLDPRALIPSVRNFYGIIKIYRKREALTRSKGMASSLIKGGFEDITHFENAKYNSTTDKGFENFGVIDWYPEVMTNDKGEFYLNIPSTGQKTVKLLIEGFSADGKMISEIKIIHLN